MRRSLIPAVALIIVSLAASVSFAAPVAPVNKSFTIEDCGTPLEVLRLVASTLYRHPDTGKLHLFLEYGNNNGYGIGEKEWEDTAHRLVDVELETGVMRRAKSSRPGGVTSNHFFHPDGKIYIFEVKTKPAGLAAYDTRTGKYETVGGFGNSAYKTVLTPSGRFYTGEVGGDVDVYDPAIRRLSRYRMPAGRKAFWGVYTMEVEEPWIYCGMTDRGKWWLTVIDTRTGKAVNYFDDPPSKGGGVTRMASGNIFFRNYLLKDGKPQMDEKGKPIRLEKKDTSARLKGNRPWPNMWRVSGYAGKTYTEALEGPGLEFDLTEAEPNNWNGGVSTIRWRKKGEERWRAIEVKGLDLVGSSPKCLGVAPDGTLVGVGSFYGAVFRFDPKTGKSEKIGPPPGSVYTILPLKDHTYFCGYVAFLAEYDHSKPYAIDKSKTWNHDTNPKRYRTVGKWTRLMQAGPDGKIYLGGSYGRHTTGGGLSIFNPTTKEMKTIREPFKYLGVAGLFFINGGKTLAITTRPVGKGPVKKGSIFLFDIDKQELVKEVKLDGLKTSPDKIFVAGGIAVIGVSRAEEVDVYGRKSNFTLVYGVDLESGELFFEKKYPGRAFTGICRYDKTPVVRGPDGCGWLFVDEALCRIHPDGTLEKVRDRMEYRGKMIWQGKTLYIYNGGRVYQRLFANVVRIPDLFRD